MAKSALDELEGMPAVARRLDFPEAGRIERHRHRCGQLVYASLGVMTVQTDAGTWVVPPQRAVWVPPEVEHEIRVPAALAMRTIYVAPEAGTGLPPHCSVTHVTPLLRELILRAVESVQPYESDGPVARLFMVLLDQIREAEVAPLSLPMPTDRRARVLAEALHEDPADPRTLKAFSRLAGGSARTLARLFVRETGMSFGAWRQQLRLLRSLELLAAGGSVTDVASAVGYDSTSAFVTMFRRAIGETPGRYFAKS